MRQTGVKAVLLEGALVAVIGAGVAFLANALSPRGLKLTVNYFPGASQPLPPVLVATNPAQPIAGMNSGPSAAERLAVRLKAQGLQLIDGKQAAELFHDPGYALDLIVFIDARDDAHYEAGHIPGAYLLDRFHAEKYFGTVLPASQRAQKIVVYCNGGDCEDSEFAASILRLAGIAGDKLFVYGGGWTEWTNHWPREIGARKSGTILQPKP